MTETVTRKAKFAWLDARRTPMPVTMSWAVADPRAVTLRFPDGVVWRFRRDLMFDGLTAADDARVGDVRFVRDPNNAGVVFLELNGLSSGGSCTAVFEVQRSVLTDFLAAVLTAESDVFLREVTACD